MANEFKSEYEQKIRETFPSYSKGELTDFIARAISERILLTLALNADEGRGDQRMVMLGILERLEVEAIKELNKREVKEHDKKENEGVSQERAERV